MLADKYSAAKVVFSFELLGYEEVTNRGLAGELCKILKEYEKEIGGIETGYGAMIALAEKERMFLIFYRDKLVGAILGSENNRDKKNKTFIIIAVYLEKKYRRRDSLYWKVILEGFLTELNEKKFAALEFISPFPGMVTEKYKKWVRKMMGLMDSKPLLEADPTYVPDPYQIDSSFFEEQNIGFNWEDIRLFFKEHYRAAKIKRAIPKSIRVEQEEARDDVLKRNRFWWLNPLNLFRRRAAK